MLHFKILSFLSFGFQWLEIILSVWYISPCVPGLGNSTFSFQCEVTLTLQGCGLAQGRFSDFQPNIYTTWELRDLLSGHTVLLGCHKQIESTLHGVPNKKLNITPLNLVFSQIFKNNHLYSGWKPGTESCLPSLVSFLRKESLFQFLFLFTLIPLFWDSKFKFSKPDKSERERERDFLFLLSLSPFLSLSLCPHPALYITLSITNI